MPLTTPVPPASRSGGAPEPEIRSGEALRSAGLGAALSHQTAARLHRLELVLPGGAHLTVARNRSRRQVDGWHVHRHELRPDERTCVDGLACTSVLRTVRDLARCLPLGESLAVAESALRLKRVTHAALVAELLSAWGGGAAHARRLVPLLHPRSDSILESLAAAVFHEHGLPPPVRQYEISDSRGTLVARADFCWPTARLVVEVDGFAFHSDRRAYRRDRDRLNRLCRLGWRVLRFTYEDVRSSPQLVAVMIRGCLLTAA